MDLDLWKFWNNCLISHLDYPPPPLQHLTAKRTTFLCLSLHGNIWDTYTRPQIQILEDYVDFVSLDCVYTRTVQHWSRSLSVLRVLFINVTLTHLWHFTMHFYECTSITGASMHTYDKSCYQLCSTLVVQIFLRPFTCRSWTPYGYLCDFVSLSVTAINPTIDNFDQFQVNSHSYWTLYVSFMNRSG